MPDRTVQLVLHYDGGRFAGWQRQPDTRTVQGEIEKESESLDGDQADRIEEWLEGLVMKLKREENAPAA